jgi:hypothetical protein
MTPDGDGCGVGVHISVPKRRPISLRILSIGQPFLQLATPSRSTPVSHRSALVTDLGCWHPDAVVPTFGSGASCVRVICRVPGSC